MISGASSDYMSNSCSLSSYTQVVRWGRSVYANIQKFIQFQLTVNVAALVINVLAAVSSGDVPLNAVQVVIFIPPHSMHELLNTTLSIIRDHALRVSFPIFTVQSMISRHLSNSWM